MKTILRLLTLAALLTGLSYGQIGPVAPPAATTAAIAAGTDQSSYVTPYGLSNGTTSTNGQILTNVSGTIQFANPPSGTLPSITGQVNNTLVVNPAGTTATWVYAPVSLSNTINSRSSRQGLVFNGSAVTGTVSLPALGTAWSVSVWLKPGSAAQWPFLYGSDVIGIRPTLIPFCDVDLPSVTLTAGKWNHLVIVGNGTTTTPYLNGAAGTGVSDTHSYRAITTLGAGPSGSVASGYLVYNRALSASEVFALYEQGAPQGADYPSQVAGTAIITGNNSTFEGAGNWTSWGGGTITVSGGVGNIVCSTSLSAGTYLATYLSQSGTVVPNYRYRLTATIGSLSAGNVILADGTTNVIGTLATTSGTFSLEFVAPSYSVGEIGIGGSASGATFTIDNVTLTPLGLLLAPGDASGGSGLVWYDESGNAANITLPASGVSWARPQSNTVLANVYGTPSFKGAINAAGNLTVTGQVIHATTATPANSSATGTTGTIEWDSSYIYVCTAPNTWKRCSLSSW